MQYPALQLSASRSSDRAQRRFLRFVRAEYALLLCVSLGYLFLPPVPGVHISLMALVLAALASAGYRAWKKPDEDWYQFRALAESVKTLTWRYAMKATPFEGSEAESRAAFRDRLRELLKVNSSLGPKFASYSADGEQITETMSAARGSSLDQRKRLYREFRIDDQRRWYQKKASGNQTAAVAWQLVLAVIYLALFAVLGARIAWPDQQLLSPDPLLVAASSVVG